MSSNIQKNILLLVSTLLICFIIFEIGYRIFDPFPHFDSRKTNFEEFAGLSQYDKILGWRGVPNKEGKLITRSSKTIVKHNQWGFRDAEYEQVKGEKEIVIFLGDSFAWGYGVSFDEMFVNILRKSLSKYEIYNLSHRGYGTDQTYLTFEGWNYKGPIKLAILMFCENDFLDNTSVVRYYTPKSKYDLEDGKLVLVNIPVPKSRIWEEKKVQNSFYHTRERLENLISKSHFIHDVAFRIYILTHKTEERPEGKLSEEAYILTEKIIENLRDRVKERKGKLVVIGIPSKKQFMRYVNYVPYQYKLESICGRLDVEYFDLAPSFERSILRTYFRRDAHWNKRGHKVATKAIEKYLED